MFFKRVFPLILRWSLLPIVPLFSPWAIWLALAQSTSANPQFPSELALFGPMFGLFLGFLGLLVIAGGSPSLRRTPFFWVFMAVLVAGWSSSFHPSARDWANAEHRAGLGKVARNAAPIIAALKKYRARTGRDAPNLNALVPLDLPAISKTGMARYPNFGYRLADSQTQFRRYELFARTPFGMNFDRFFYWPEEKYPPRNGEGWFEPMGNWAYLHE